MPKKISIFAFIPLLFGFAFLLNILTLNPAQAATSTVLIPTPSGPKTNCSDPNGNCGDYTLNDFVQLGINITNIILGVVGSLSLLMLVYGGFSFLISAGNADSVSKATKILVAAVVGLLIVFTSFIIIQFVLQGLGYTSALKIPWNKTPN